MLRRNQNHFSFLFRGNSRSSTYFYSSTTSLFHSSSTPSSSPSSASLSLPPIPSHSRVVILGGGVIGCSVAYHLTKLGWKDILLLERGQLSCGTTWHAAGLIGQLRDTETETKLSGVYGAKLLQELEQETGLSTGFKPCGSLTLATSKDRLTQLKIRSTKAKSFGIESSILTPREALEMYPYLNIDDLQAALWLPGDGSAISSDVTQALARGARLASNNQIQIIENCNVIGISTTHSPSPSRSSSSSSLGSSSSSPVNPVNRVTAVHTDRGDVTCEIVVNCCGLWSRQVGNMCGVSVPLASAEHYYIYSRPFTPPVSSMLPILRDPDAYIYYREWSGGLLMGGFEPQAKPVFEGLNGPPRDFSFSLLPEDWEHFEILMKGALHRTPCLGNAQVKMINGPESFTPDNQYILGESPEVKGFYVAAGFNSSGIASSGGAGKALAEWIVNGEPTTDLWSVDIRRFSGQVHNNSQFLSARVSETLGLHYQITWPKRELETGRGLRKSPLYSTHSQLNACFGSKFGWERVNFYVPSDRIPTEQKSFNSTNGISMLPYSYGRQWWFDLVEKEHQNCRQNVTLFDLTSFSKLLLQGKDSVNLLQKLCVNNIDISIGKLVYTTMCNPRGGIETDLTICRLKSDQFLIITSTSQGTRDKDWIQSQINKDPNLSVILTDITSSYGVISLMGPKSRELLSYLTTTDISHEKFPFGTSIELDIGQVNVRAHRITYVGELGYELYIPTESTQLVYDTVQKMANVKNILLSCGGYFAIDSLRLEKGYRAWGHDITPNDTPIEAGLSFTIDWKKSIDFIGRDVLLRQKKDGVHKRLVSVLIDEPVNPNDPSLLSYPYPYGGEPIFRNGILVGYLTSAGYGYTLKKAIGLAYISSKNMPFDEKGTPQIVDNQFLREGKYEIELSDGRYHCTVTLKSPHDPNGKNIFC